MQSSLDNEPKLTDHLFAVNKPVNTGKPIHKESATGRQQTSNTSHRLARRCTFVVRSNPGWLAQTPKSTRPARRPHGMREIRSKYKIARRKYCSKPSARSESAEPIRTPGSAGTHRRARQSWPTYGLDGASLRHEPSGVPYAWSPR